MNILVTKCEVCQSVKSGGKKVKAHLNNMVDGAPLDRLSADILDQLPECLAGAYRTTQHASTNLTPNLMMLGREVRLPHEIVSGKTHFHTDKGVAAYSDYVF